MAAAELPFSVAEAKLQALPVEQIVHGLIEAVNQSTVSAQTAGRVEDIMVDVNDFVPQGAPIIRLRNIGGLDQRRRACAKPRLVSRKLKPNIPIRRVYDRQLVSKAQMDSATAAYDAAKARLEAARASRKRGSRWGTPRLTRLIAASCCNAMSNWVKPYNLASR